MSNGGLEPDEEIEGRSPSDAQVSLLVPVLALASAGFAMFQLFPILPLSTRMMLMALCIISLRLWGGLMLLAAAALDLYLREPTRSGPFDATDSVTWVLLIAAVAVLGYRQRPRLQKLSNRSIRSLIRDLRGDVQPREDVAAESDAGFDNSGNRPQEQDFIEKLLEACMSGMRAMLVLLGIIVSSALLLDFLPRGGRLARSIRTITATDPDLAGIALLAVIVIAGLLIIGELTWRQLTPAQARMFLRTLRLTLLFEEQRNLAQQNLKERLRRVRSRHSVNSSEN